MQVIEIIDKGFFCESHKTHKPTGWEKSSFDAEGCGTHSIHSAKVLNIRKKTAHVQNTPCGAM